MTSLLPAISGIGLAVYPLFVLVGMRYLDVSTLWMVLLLLVGLRILSARWFQRVSLLLKSVIVLFVLILLALPTVVELDFMLGLRFYPVVASLAVFSIFAASLFSKMPVAERFARLREPALPPEGVRYTRHVTQCWAVFLFINACIALVTALWASDLVWALYNGFISYCLVAVLFSIEYLYRQHARRGWSLP